jgi:hypothetical protein
MKACLLAKPCPLAANRVEKLHQGGPGRVFSEVLHPLREIAAPRPFYESMAGRNTEARHGN